MRGANAASHHSGLPPPLDGQTPAAAFAHLQRAPRSQTRRMVAILVTVNSRDRLSRYPSVHLWLKERMARSSPTPRQSKLAIYDPGADNKPEKCRKNKLFSPSQTFSGQVQIRMLQLYNRTATYPIWGIK